VGARDAEDGFGEVFDRYAPAILRYAQRRLDSREREPSFDHQEVDPSWPIHKLNHCPDHAGPGPRNRHRRDRFG